MARPGLLMLIAVAALSCYPKSPQNAGEYFSSPEYQSREPLQESLFRGDLALLSNEEISIILDSKIELPRQASVAVLHLGDPTLGLSWSVATSDHRWAVHPMAGLAESSRIARVAPLPSLLIPERAQVPQLREAAARFQADLLVVYRAPCQRFQQYRLIGKDEARTYCVVEAVLLDVRTGVIPYSTAASRAVEAVKSEEDVNLHEAATAAGNEATNEALRLVTQELVSFLDSVP